MKGTSRPNKVFPFEARTREALFIHPKIGKETCSRFLNITEQRHIAQLAMRLRALFLGDQ